MGKYNSSLTRVQPVFEILLKRDPSGSSWLPILLDLAISNSAHSKALPGMIGNIIQKEQGYFEITVPPPERFLIWLVKNPNKMKWPMQKGKRKEFGHNTQIWREKLFGLHGEGIQNIAIKKAIEKIKINGAKNSRRKWWAFEGFTTVDCCLETDELLLFIEGKRKDTLSKSTEWYAKRSQLSRNLEACKELAERKDYGVILLSEQPQDINLLAENIKDSFPHLDRNEKNELLSHFFGIVHWKYLCRATNIEYSRLPNSVLD